MLRNVSLVVAFALALFFAPSIAPSLLGEGAASIAYAQAEKKPKAKAKTPKVKGIIYMTPKQCVRTCMDRGPGRTEAHCSPWCQPGCRNAATGERFCVK